MTKKVKFASLAEEEEFYQEFDKDIGVDVEGGEEENDLDLDTIRARSKSRQIKNIDDADEDEEDDMVEEEEKESIKEEEVVNWDTESENESEAEESPEEDDDDREIPLEPFNLKGDREEGNFDADGFFVRNVDEDAGQDRWMANLTRSDIAKARRAHQNQMAKEKPAEESLSLCQIYTELLSLMQPGQSVLSAIRSKSTTSQLTNPTPRGPPPNKNRLKKMMATQAASSSENSEAYSQKKREMNRLTELADMLMNRGNFGVYDETFEDISQRLKS